MAESPPLTIESAELGSVIVLPFNYSEPPGPLNTAYRRKSASVAPSLGRCLR